MLTGFNMLKGGGGKLTPSFPRGGLAALFSVEILGLVGSPTSMAIDVEHKNIEDTSWAVAGSFSSITTAGGKSVEVGTLKKQVRFALSVTATNEWEGFYTLIPAPTWRPY